MFTIQYNVRSFLELTRVLCFQISHWFNWFWVLIHACKLTVNLCISVIGLCRFEKKCGFNIEDVSPFQWLFVCRGVSQLRLYVYVDSDNQTMTCVHHLKPLSSSVKITYDICAARQRKPRPFSGGNITKQLDAIVNDKYKSMGRNNQ